MRVHPIYTHLSGVVTIALQAQFVGDPTDASDNTKIAAYGDVRVNLGGTFQDPDDSSFTFHTGSSLVMVGVTTEMHDYPVTFMTALPAAVPGKPIPSQGPLVVITPDPVRASAIWKNIVVGRITSGMTALRGKASPVSTLPDSTV